MATSRRKKPEHAALAEKAPSQVHSGFAEFINKTTGVEVPAEHVALVQRAYPLYLKTPEVVKAREAQKAERQKAKDNATEAKKARLRARLDKIEAERQAVLARMGVEGVDPENVGPTPLAVVANDVDPDPTQETYEGDEAVASEVTLAEAVAETADDDDDWDDEPGDDSDEEEF